MFKNNAKKFSKSYPVTAQIGANEFFKGILCSDGIIRIYGEVIGKIVGKNGHIPELIIIEKEGNCKGVIIGKTIVIRGKFQGKCMGHHVFIEGQAGGFLYYDGSFQIEPANALINGSVVKCPLSNFAINGDSIEETPLTNLSSPDLRPAQLAA